MEAPDAAGSRPMPLPFDPDRCPFTAAWRVLGGKWKGVIWWRLSMGLVRFGDLRAAIPQVSQKMLTQQLRELERAGLVNRQVHPQVPPRVEYSLTERGRSLTPVMDALCVWGAQELARAAARAARQPE